MAEEVESHTIRLLQEMRESIGRIDGNLQAMRTEVTDLTQRVDGNTLVFNLVAGVVLQSRGAHRPARAGSGVIVAAS